MPRSHASARKAGSSFERSIADHLRDHVDDRIDRRVKTGAKDRGDIGGLRHMGIRIVGECKNTTRINLGTWLTETDIERRNDDAAAGLVFHKRHGKGHPGAQLVTMTVDDLIAILTGQRPGEAPATAGAA